MYSSASLLEGATNSAARMIRTGQIQQSASADPEQLFRDEICDYARVLIRCSDVEIEVLPMNSFSDVATMGTMLSGDDGAIAFMSTIVLQTEPYEFTGGA